MNKNLFIYLFIFIFTTQIVFSTYTLDISYPTFMDFDETEYVNVTFYSDGVKLSNISNCVIITYNTSSGVLASSNMSYSNDSTMLWYAGFIESSSEADYFFNVTAFSDVTCSSTQVTTFNHFLRFRKSFNVTLNFYKSMINDGNLSQATEKYCNEFQYIGMSPYNSSQSNVMIKDLSYLDRWFGWMPFYEKEIDREFDNTLTFWDDYSGCSAKVKLYEKGNYTIKFITTDVKGVKWDDEFHYPQFDDGYYVSEIKDKFDLTTEENLVVKVIVSAWELSKFRLLMNIFLWVVIFLIWLLITILISSTGWKAVVGWTIGYFTIIKILGFVVF